MYVRSSRRVLGIPGSKMIDQTNAAEFEFVGDFWSMQSSEDLLRNG